MTRYHMENVTWEQFRGKSGGLPIVSINKQGQFYLNSTIQRNQFKDVKYASLFWDKKGRRIGIKPEKDKREYIYRIYQGRILAQAFFKEYEIQLTATEKYQVGWNRDYAMLIIQLGGNNA